METILSLEEIRRQLSDRNLREVARRTGISPFTLYRMMNGTTPNYETIRALSDYLRGGSDNGKE